METTTKSYSQDFGEDDLNIVDQLSLDNVLKPNHHTIVRRKGLYSGRGAAGLAAELPAPELLDCRRDLPPPDLPVSAAVQLPENTRRSSRKASAAVQLPEYTEGAAGMPPALVAARRLQRRPDVRKG
ncbi:unnamed protein product [Boreogadus saida]